MGGAPDNPSWYYNLVTDPNVEISDKSDVYSMKVREVSDSGEKQRLWDIAVEAYPLMLNIRKKPTERSQCLLLNLPRVEK